MTTSIETQLKTLEKHLKWLPYQIQGGKTEKNVKIDPQTMLLWSTKLKVTL